MRSWSLTLEGDILTVDPSQNLIISRRKTISSAAVVCAAITLDAGAPHPSCITSDSHIIVPSPAEWIHITSHYTRYSVLDGTLLVTFADRTRCSNVFMDWRTGGVLAVFNPPFQDPAPANHRPSIPSLLSSNSFLCGSFDLESGVASIDVYIMESSPLLIKRFQLPVLVDVVMACVTFSFAKGRGMGFSSTGSWHTQRDTHSLSVLLETRPEALFDCDPMSSVLMVNLHTGPAAWAAADDAIIAFYFYTPAWPFLVAASSSSRTPSVKPWTAWGPQQTRWVADPPVNGLGIGWLPHREGSRMLTTSLLIDFAPFVVRNSPSHAQYRNYRLITEPTSIRHPHFVDEILSQLPYFERDLENPGAEADDFLLTGRTIVTINVSADMVFCNMAHS
jgi:hypothetical protein